jgi:hypothetical protein
VSQEPLTTAEQRVVDAMREEVNEALHQTKVLAAPIL